MVSGAPLYTYSFTIVALMLLVSGLGAVLGLWVWLGFTVTDLVVANHALLPGIGFHYRPDPLGAFIKGYLPLALAYGLLFGLLVLAPLVARAFALRTEAVVRARRVTLARLAGALVYVLVLAGLSYGWAHALPFLIRPIWSFSGGSPAVAAIQPIQSNAGWLAAAAVLAGVVRAVLTRIATPRLRRLPTPQTAPPRQSVASAVVGRLVGIPVQALILTLLLGGLVSTIFLGVLLWLVICVILLTRVFAVPLIPGTPRGFGRFRYCCGSPRARWLATCCRRWSWSPPSRAGSSRSPCW
jgi:hypothetical protein